MYATSSAWVVLQRAVLTLEGIGEVFPVGVPEAVQAVMKFCCIGNTGITGKQLVQRVRHFAIQISPGKMSTFLLIPGFFAFPFRLDKRTVSLLKNPLVYLVFTRPYCKNQTPAALCISLPLRLTV